jgi:hypothetical protein
VLESPQSFVVREECEKAAFQNGYRRGLGENQGWAAFASTTAHGTIFLAAAGIHGPWFLALDHTGVIAELDSPAADVPGPGKVRYTFGTLGEFYAVLARVYALGVSLPDAPLLEFQQRIESLPKTTEAERLVVQRIGQDIFRTRLMDYWQGCCPLTGISDPQLLRASHIVPWAECESDAKRLDVHNGLLLSALWDAAFDAGLVGFDDDGRVIASPSLTTATIDALNLRLGPTLKGLTEVHRANLAWHRKKYGLEIDRRVAEPARDS